ncbi:hypothetical protein C8J57DRAFT_1509651 [Mycena rebaudengoi]|nr:hypothetical protein C8J57DRAFT_1509651 [Mycena rebaudengoi]
MSCIPAVGFKLALLLLSPTPARTYTQPPLLLAARACDSRLRPALVHRLYRVGMRSLCLRPHTPSRAPPPRASEDAATAAAVADPDGGDVDALPNNDAGPAQPALAPRPPPSAFPPL